MVVNKIFPLAISTIENHALVANSMENDSMLWHLQYKHLNFKD